MRLHHDFCNEGICYSILYSLSNVVWGSGSMPKISVVVPVYCAEDYLKGCMDSLVSQNFDDYEVVAVDDGSIDRSALILDRYAQVSSSK